MKAKKAIKGITRSRRPRRKQPPTPYKAVEHAASEEHSVDAAVERRLPQKKLLREMRSLSDRMMAALGDERQLWLRLEEVLGDYHLQREQAYFGIGYEHGLAAGRVEALQALMPMRASMAYRRIGAEPSPTMFETWPCRPTSRHRL